MRKPNAPHSQDSDCTLDPATDCCVECGVYHGDACPDCGERGFHTPDCPVVLFVPEALRCPGCGENRMDFITPEEDYPSLHCHSCGSTYRMQSLEREDS